MTSSGGLYAIARVTRYGEKAMRDTWREQSDLHVSIYAALDIVDFALFQAFGESPGRPAPNPTERGC